VLKPNIQVKEPQTVVLDARVGVNEKLPLVPLLPPGTLKGIPLLSQSSLRVVRVLLVHAPEARFHPVGHDVHVTEDEQVLHVKWQRPQVLPAGKYPSMQ
jgi:hypothetical protein